CQRSAGPEDLPERPRREARGASSLSSLARACHRRFRLYLCAPRGERARPGGADAAAPPWSFRVLREIARGGMGSVLLARAEGAQGFSRTVVIKRILAPLATSPVARGRFLDETRLMARMPHPHIAQVLDLLEEPD